MFYERGCKEWCFSSRLGKKKEDKKYKEDKKVFLFGVLWKLLNCYGNVI